MKKISILFLVVLFSLVLTGCLPGQKDSQPETKETEKKESSVQAGWETYQNPDYQFSFSYPPDWKVDTVIDQKEFLSIILKLEDLTQEKLFLFDQEMMPSYEISVVVEENKKGLTAKQLRLSQFSESSRAEEEKRLETVMVGGVEGVKCKEGAAPASGSATMVIVVFEGNIYRFTYSALAHTSTHEKYLSVFNQLVNSVKFGQ